MRVLFGPVAATMTSAPEGSSIACAVGEAGVLVVGVSESRHPGMVSATLYYTPGRAPDAAEGFSFETERFATTACGRLEVSGREVAIEAGGGRYEFRAGSMASAPRE